jgi:hypothetical protein
MNNRIPNELTIGDVIRSAKSTEQYRVIRFSGNPPVILAELEHVRTGKTMMRTTTQIMVGWRLVKQA